MPWRARDFVHHPLRRRGGLPQLKRDPLGSARPYSDHTRSMQSHPTRLMILVAGPYRSGTGDDPAKLAANVAAMEAFAMPLFRAGHVPLVGEWLGLPPATVAGAVQIGAAAVEVGVHPIRVRLLGRGDVLPG